MHRHSSIKAIIFTASLIVVEAQSAYSLTAVETKALRNCRIWGGNNLDIIQALRLSAANSLNQTGQQVVRRNLNIQPTLTIRPGFPVRVIVNRDLVLEPYGG